MDGWYLKECNMLTEKDYFENDNISIRRQPYWYILPCMIVCKDKPHDCYKGWTLHLGVLCFSIDFNW